MGLYWLATEAKTGNIIGDLPDLDVTTVKSLIGRYDTTTATLPLPSAPENWDRLTLPGGTHLILLADNPNDPTHGIPLWGGRITTRDRTEGDLLELSLATVESYADTRYVGDYAPVGVGQNTIVSTLMTSYVLAGINGGVPFRIAMSGVDTPRTVTYQNSNNTTVYSMMQDLMGLTGGCEWTVGWEWQTAPERITPVLYVGSRLGSPVSAGFGPNATFEMPGPVKTFRYKENFSSGKGANVAVASGSGTSTARPQSPAQSVTDLVRPTLEYRWTPSSSVSDVPSLTSYAATAVTAMSRGTNAIELSAVMGQAPQLGVDWFVGDDIGYQIGLSGPVASVPNGLSGVARAVGFQIEISNTSIITPILVGTSF